MNTEQMIEVAGGRKAVIMLTGLKRARISQWCTQNYMPPSWVKFFQATFPAIRNAKLDLSPAPPQKKGRRSV